MLTLKIYGNYSPNTIGLPGSCYLLEGMSKKIIFDLGNGNFKKIKKDLSEDDLENSLLILSHNHVDHSWDVLKLALYLMKKSKKINIYLPKKSFIYWIIAHLNKVFNVHIITEETKINIDNFNISFCKTIHRGESYATKIVGEDIDFVYTSDMADVSKNVKMFCKDANVVLVDSGHPCKDELFSLNGYHGKTTDILNQLFDSECNVKKVLASHLKANLRPEAYMLAFPPNKDVILVRRGKIYNLI
ncbi:MAG: MBL fold metallo-hydrolase [Clostridia bacterium]|nr:MBL fold metallo-hydrolase [Clostridia bacterium]